jgi:hypothetical protein
MVCIHAILLNQTRNNADYRRYLKIPVVFVLHDISATLAETFMMSSSLFK